MIDETKYISVLVATVHFLGSGSGRMLECVPLPRKITRGLPPPPNILRKEKNMRAKSISIACSSSLRSIAGIEQRIIVLVE